MHENESWSFATEDSPEANAVGVLDRMESVEHCLKRLAAREADVQDFQASTGQDMGLDWIPGDQDSAKRGGVFVMKHPDFGSKDGMVLDQTAVKSACRLMGVPWAYFEKFENPHREFAVALRKIIDHKGEGVVIRTGTRRDGLNRRIEAIVPSEFNRTSDGQILGAMLTRLQADYAEQIRGVQTLNDGKDGTLNYRILFGNPMLREDDRDPSKAVIPMLSFLSNEYGMVDSKVALGLFRIICRNGMMRTDWEGGIAKWSRKNNPNGFLSKVGDVIGNVGHFAAGVANVLGDRIAKPLGAPAIEIIGNLHQRSLIGAKHFDAAARACEYSPAGTEYDLLNILTDSAKHLNPLTARQDAESTALRLAMQPNGFSGVYLEGFSKDAAKSQHVVLATA